MKRWKNFSQSSNLSIKKEMKRNEERFIILKLKRKLIM